jgi:hypothetical protein
MPMSPGVAQRSVVRRPQGEFKLGNGHNGAPFASPNALFNNDSFLLIDATVRVAQRLWRNGFRYAKTGVVFVDLCRTEQATTQFFPSRDAARWPRSCRLWTQ